MTLDLTLESLSLAVSMRQPSRSTKPSKPPDLSAWHPDQQPPRSRRQHNCQYLVLLGLLLLGLLPCSLGAHVHVNKQMRDHLQQVGVLSFCVFDTACMHQPQACSSKASLQLDHPACPTSLHLKYACG
jgi:hypothetical protein